MIMDQVILEQLKKLTKEEQEILDGRQEIDPENYMDHVGSTTVDCKKLLEKNMLISIRTHTRFVAFPKHQHNYVEMVYMCAGQTNHIVNDKKITLKCGEILLMNQFATQEVEEAGAEDIAVNFIILPEFFERVFGIMDQDNNLIREFLIHCLRNENAPSGYLHFKVADCMPVQNLLENLIWTIMHRQKEQRRINQTTMGLLFLYLPTLVDQIEKDTNNFEQNLLLKVYQYIEEQYAVAELGTLSEELGYDIYWLSRFIKNYAGSNFTDLVQKKRLQHAVNYLQNTTLPVSEIAEKVGYANISFFYRIFKKTYGMSPKEFRNS